MQHIYPFMTLNFGQCSCDLEVSTANCAQPNVLKTTQKYSAPTSNQKWWTSATKISTRICQKIIHASIPVMKKIMPWPRLIHPWTWSNQSTEKKSQCSVQLSQIRAIDFPVSSCKPRYGSNRCITYTNLNWIEILASNNARKKMGSSLQRHIGIYIVSSTPSCATRVQNFGGRTCSNIPFGACASVVNTRRVQK